MYNHRSPVGYRSLLTWKQAGEIDWRAKDFTRLHLDRYSDMRLIGHINDSARSVQRNIEEGYKRRTTKEYAQFLGFSLGSLEELKGDFEELKREWGEGIRWAEKGVIRERVEKGVAGGGIGKVAMRETVGKEIAELLDLIYGEDCMIGRQVEGLEKRMAGDKTMPRGEMIQRCRGKAESNDRRFWRLSKERFGIVRAEKGVIRVEKGEDKGEVEGGVS